MEPESSLLCSRKPTTKPYSEAYVPRPNLRNVFLLGPVSHYPPTFTYMILPSQNVCISDLIITKKIRKRRRFLESLNKFCKIFSRSKIFQTQLKCSEIENLVSAVFVRFVSETAYRWPITRGS